MAVLSDEILISLSGTMRVWAAEHLTGKPAILLNMAYMKMEAVLTEETQEINSTFSKGEEHISQ